MRFGIRECANIVFRANKDTKIGTKTFKKGQPVLYIDTAKTSTLAQASSTSYAQGGRGNSRLIAWEGDKTLTFNVEDALLSPIGFSVLSGAGLFKPSGINGGKVHFHVTTMASANGTGEIDLTDALKDFGTGATIGTDDAPLYIMGVDTDGSITGEIYSGTIAGNKITAANAANKTVMVDFYVDLDGSKVYEADITANTFAGSYYVEADTLFRRQEDGKDVPANLTLPNVKIQSNFSIAMSGSGDPSAFSFNMDAFPGYTYFDKTKKVLCVLQIADIAGAESSDHPVMPQNSAVEDNEIGVGIVAP